MALDASGSALAGALKEGVYLIKPNLRELEDLTGRPLGDENERLAAAREIIVRGGAELVALTRPPCSRPARRHATKKTCAACCRWWKSVPSDRGAAASL